MAVRDACSGRASVRGPPLLEAGDSRLGARPASGIVVRAQSHRTLIEDFCPLAQSIEWKLGQRYLQERGNKAFIIDPVPVPFAINGDGNLSCSAAEVLFASLVAAERTAMLEGEVRVLELGVGLGLFARYFLDAFRDLCIQNDKNYYERLTYVAADRSERMLLDVARHGVLADHLGHYRLCVMDALCPDLDLPMTFSATCESCSRFHAIFLNYLLDCLPAAVLRIDQNDVRQLCVRTCLARGVQLSAYTDQSPEDLARKANSSDPCDERELMDCFPVLVSEYEMKPVDASILPYREFAVQCARGFNGNLIHSYGAIQCLERLLDLVSEQGFILINDYGSAQTTEAGEFEHQRYTGSTFVGVNFALLKGYFGDSGKYHWVDPAEDNGHIFSRLLGSKLAPETVAGFQDRFSKAAFDWRKEPADVARGYLKQSRIEAATTAYREALVREPRNWMLMGEVAKFLTFSLRQPSAGLDMAKAALALNPSCSPDLWNTLGDSLFMLGRIEDARSAFLRALQVNPNDVRARYNLAFVYIRENDLGAALKSIAEGLGLDRGGEFREGLLQKQSEILAILAQRHQQEFQAMADRVSRNDYQGKARADGTCGVRKPGADGTAGNELLACEKPPIQIPIPSIERQEAMAVKAT